MKIKSLQGLQSQCFWKGKDGRERKLGLIEREREKSSHSQENSGPIGTIQHKNSHLTFLSSVIVIIHCFTITVNSLHRAELVLMEN